MKTENLNITNTFVSGASTVTEPAARDLTTDAELADLWQQLVTTSAELDVAEKALEAARADFRQPEWTDAMLSEHAIPASLGRSPDSLQILDLNKALLESACTPFASGDRPDEASRLAHSWGVSPNCAPPEVQAVMAVNDARWDAFKTVARQKEEEEACVGIKALDDETEAIVVERNEILDEILNTSHKTQVGQMVRLRAWLIQTTGWGHENAIAEIENHHTVVIDMIRDLEQRHADITAALPRLPLYDTILLALFEKRSAAA